MEKSNLDIVNAALKRFSISGEITEIRPFGNGHINDTIRIVSVDKVEGKNTYILQTINSLIFKKPAKVMSNIEKVINHLKKKITDPRGTLEIIPTTDGKTFFMDEYGHYWRMYRFIEDAICIESPESTEDFYECGVAFGKFQRDLSDFPAEELFEVLPDFHNTVKRYEIFLKAVKEDKVGRAERAMKEIAFITERADFYSVLAKAHSEGKLPLRVSHNDTKTNNAMLDKATRKALCVIDLDTIMPGFSVTDFGDAIRSGAATAAEDEKDITKVNFDLDMFASFAKGFLTGTGGQLENSEIMLMPEGAKMMTIECGMRFLTDFLQGDTYFKTKYPDHNLTRCRTQLKLVFDMEQNFDKMKEIVLKFCK